MRQETRIEHWKYHDGWRDVPNILREFYGGETRIFEEYLVGWHCWAYVADDIDFTTWMDNNMTGYYECDLKFNSGDPMYLIIIRNDEDATLFKIRWM
jgi:hypothetical protein